MTRKKKFDWPKERQKFLNENPDLKQMDEELTSLEQSLWQRELAQIKHWHEQQRLQGIKHFKVTIKMGWFNQYEIGLFKNREDAESWVKASFANEIAKDGSYFPKIQYRIQESLP